MPREYSEKSIYKAKALFIDKRNKKTVQQIASLKEQKRYEEAAIKQKELDRIKALPRKH